MATIAQLDKQIQTLTIQRDAIMVQVNKISVVRFTSIDAIAVNVHAQDLPSPNWGSGGTRDLRPKATAVVNGREKHKRQVRLIIHYYWAEGRVKNWESLWIFDLGSTPSQPLPEILHVTPGLCRVLLNSIAIESYYRVLL